MHRFAWTVAAFGLCLMATACSGDGSRQIMNKEDMLVASGFKFVPANTPERQAATALQRQAAKRATATASAGPRRLGPGGLQGLSVSHMSSRSTSALVVAC